MSPSLTAEFEHLFTRMDEMVDKIKNLPSDTQRTPVGKSFSPEKALEHMGVLEKGYVDQIQKTSAAKLQNRQGKPNFFYPLVLKQMTKPAGTASPTPPVFQPKQGKSIEESAKFWKEQRTIIVDYLKRFDDNAAAVKSTFFGYLSPRDIYVLLERHQDYHDARLPN